MKIVNVSKFLTYMWINSVELTVMCLGPEVNLRCIILFSFSHWTWAYSFGSVGWHPPASASLALKWHVCTALRMHKSWALYSGLHARMARSSQLDHLSRLLNFIRQHNHLNLRRKSTRPQNLNTCARYMCLPRSVTTCISVMRVMFFIKIH